MCVPAQYMERGTAWSVGHVVWVERERVHGRSVEERFKNKETQPHVCTLSFFLTQPRGVPTSSDRGV